MYCKPPPCAMLQAIGSAESHISTCRNSLKIAAQRTECWHRKVPFLIDSQVVVNVIARGRSSSHQLNYILQTSLALCLFCHMTPLPLYMDHIGTEENPADDPTRGRGLRERLLLSPQASHAIERISEQHRWVFLVTWAQWAAKKRTWDASLGFPGEGPQKKELPMENKGKDLRVRVSPVTMRRYAERINALQCWLDQHDLGEVKQLAMDPSKINAAVMPYLQGLYNEQKPVSHGSLLLAGIQLYYPQTTGHLH
eukprot:4099831-Amphidinium_carterae.5